MDYPYQYPYLRKEEKKSHKWIFLIIILAVIVVLFFVGFKVFFDSTPEQLMDLRIVDIDSQVERGDKLDFEVEALNLGSSKRYDIYMRYDVLNSDGNYFSSLRKEETVALSDKSAFPNSILLNLPPGRYTLRVSAGYSGGKAEASESFFIIGSVNESEEDEIEEPEVEIEEESEAEEIEDEEERVSITRVYGKSDDELESSAIEKCSSNFQEAINLCSSISSSYNADYCLNGCAERSSKSSFCAAMKDSDRKDDCYMTLALKGKKDLCRYIKNGYKKNTCTALT